MNGRVYLFRGGASMDSVSDAVISGSGYTGWSVASAGFLSVPGVESELRSCARERLGKIDLIFGFVQHLGRVMQRNYDLEHVGFCLIRVLQAISLAKLLTKLIP